MQYLLLGPRYNQKDKTKTGGIVVLFENWIAYCTANKTAYSVIDTNKSNYPNIVFAYCSILLQILFKSFSSKTIFLHGTAKDYLYIAPIVVLIGKLFCKKIVLRKFAGDFKTRYIHSNRLQRWIISTILKKSDICFWETKSLVLFGLSFNINSFWFPNVRNRERKFVPKKSYNKRFVFISQVRKEKGIDILLQSFKDLDLSFSIDIYGPLIDYEKVQLDFTNIRYCKPLLPQEVYSTLSQYDCLILPSFREGYPGIIIEAFSVGVPVIATNIGGIPEIVENGVNGILIEPKNVEDLTRAIKSINQSNYQPMAENAFDSFKNFDAEIVNDRIYKIINER